LLLFSCVCLGHRLWRWMSTYKTNKKTHLRKMASIKKKDNLKDEYAMNSKTFLVSKNAFL
jgi:CMP-N-acetylneuraminic acid synthetase